MCTTLLQINNLSKKYHRKYVLKNVNIKLESNVINIIIGENGCGKSTLIKCINDLITYEGNIKKDLEVSYFPEKINLPLNLKVIDFLLLISKNKKKIRKINLEYFLNIFKLNQHLNKKIKELSFGTKQKIILIQTLLEDSDIYIFDEPLNGLDDEMSKILMNEINQLFDLKKLIIIVSHDHQRFKFNNIRVIKIKEGIVND